MTDQTNQNQGSTPVQDQIMPEITLDLADNQEIESNEPEISIDFSDLNNESLDINEEGLEINEKNLDINEENLDTKDEDLAMNDESLAMNDENLDTNNEDSDIDKENIEEIKSDFDALNIESNMPENIEDSDSSLENEVLNVENSDNGEGMSDSMQDSELETKEGELEIEEETSEKTNTVPWENETSTDLLESQEEKHTDDWLEKEDALLAEKEDDEQESFSQDPVIEKKEEPKITDDLSVLDIVPDVWAENNVWENEDFWWNLEQVNQNFPENSSWESDQEIISQLQTTESQIEPVPNETIPSQTELNLDDLLGSDTDVVVEWQVNPAVWVNQNPVETMQFNIPQQVATTVPQQVAPQETVPQQAVIGVQWFAMPAAIQNISNTIKDPRKKNIFIGIWVGTLAILIWIFMLKTMYPMGFGQTSDVDVPNNLEEQLVDNSLNLDEQEDEQESDLFNNPALDNYHSSPFDFDGISDEEFNAFEDIEAEMEPDYKLIDRLENFVEVGRKYAVIGKRNKDDDITKYSLFLYRKAAALLTDIENWKQITTDELDKELDDLETYLQKLTGKNSDGEMILPQTNIPSPEEFFWNEDFWWQDEELERWEESEESTWETEEIEDEDLSGDEDSILQLD